MKLDQIYGKLSASQQLFEALDDDGDSLEAIHLIEHFFVADKAEKLEKLLEMTDFLGYGRTGVQEENAPKIGRYHCCNVLSHAPILGEDYAVFVAPAREAIIMMSIAEAFGCSYDGWGTKAIPRESQQAGPSNGG